MKRREFVAASCLAPVAGLCAAAETQTPQRRRPRRDLIELRLYQIESGEKRKQMDRFLAKAAIPAFNRLGIQPVGVFQLAEGDRADLYVLLRHESLRTLLASAPRLMADDAFCEAAAEVLDAPMKDPVYQRVESSLFLSFDSVPKLELPTKAASRVFQLRIYESHNLLKARKKIQMFNEGGEVDIFRRVGMPPVFFGDAIVGGKLPNLTYMLGFDDQAALDAGWAKFRGDPAWLKLKGESAYKDTVSAITNIVLRPTEYSQV